jgi:hypothetical protein
MHISADRLATFSPAGRICAMHPCSHASRFPLVRLLVRIRDVPTNDGCFVLTSTAAASRHTPRPCRRDGTGLAARTTNASPAHFVTSRLTVLASPVPIAHAYC